MHQNAKVLVLKLNFRGTSRQVDDLAGQFSAQAWARLAYPLLQWTKFMLEADSEPSKLVWPVATLLRRLFRL